MKLKVGGCGDINKARSERSETERQKRQKSSFSWNWNPEARLCWAEDRFFKVEDEIQTC